MDILGSDCIVNYHYQMYCTPYFLPYFKSE